MMKKGIICYFAVLVLGNLWIARILGELSGAAIVTCEEANVKPLPAISDAILPLGGWPAWVLLVAALIGLVLSLLPRIPRQALLHFVIFLLFAESFFLFVTTVAYSVPFINYHPPSCHYHHSRRQAASHTTMSSNTTSDTAPSAVSEAVQD